MNTENLSTLKIHKLTQAQYDRELAAGRIDANALYLTPDEVNDSIDYATQQELDDLETLVGTLPEGTSATSVVDYINIKTAGVSTDAALEELQNQLDGKAELSHNHDSTYDAIGSAEIALATAKEYTNTKTSGLASTATVENAISTHSTSTSAHNDIRVLIADLTEKLNAFLDVDDATTDQLSEVLTLINNNKGTLESLTTNKINVSDIVNNLTTNSTSKVLSAAQGVVIKGLIDALDAEIDTKANASHTHPIANITNLQSTLDGKAASSHTHTVSQISDLAVTVKELNYMDGVTSNVQTQLDAKAASSHSHSISNITDLQATLDGKAAQTSLDSHASDTTKHITSTERTNWNTAYTHSTTAHAPSNAEKNQNAFSNIKVGSTTVAADTTTDTVTFEGSNVTITPDTTNDKITFIVADGSTSAKGVVQLTNSTSSTSTTTAATPSSVKSAYDLANTAKSAADAAKSTADSKANATHTHTIANVTNLQSSLDAKVPTSRTINGKSLTSNITLSASDLSAYTKSEIDNMEFITINDIDTICGGSVVAASEVTY